MKNISLLIIALCLVFSAYAGENKKYIKTMEGAIKQLYEAKSLESFDPVTNKFSRIAEAEGDKWMPYYYVALSHVFKSFRIKDIAQKDEVLDQALVALTKAYELEKNNSEITALEGFVYMMKISVDPGSRGQTLSPKAMAAFGKAMQLDPANPRAVLFMGQMHYGMAQFFGSGTDEACATVARSVELFDSAKPESSIAPIWGKSSALQYIEQCKSATEGKTEGN